MRLLLVEDDDSLARALRRGLSTCGFAVDHAESAETAALLVDENPYDLIILDLSGPHDSAMTHVVSQSNIDGAGNDLTAEPRTDAQLRKIIDAIPVLAWCNRPDGSNEFLNQRWQDYTGLSQGDFSARRSTGDTDSTSERTRACGAWPARELPHVFVNSVKKRRR